MTRPTLRDQSWSRSNDDLGEEVKAVVQPMPDVEAAGRLNGILESLVPSGFLGLLYYLDGYAKARRWGPVQGTGGHLHSLLQVWLAAGSSVLPPQCRVRLAAFGLVARPQREGAAPGAASRAHGGRDAGGVTALARADARARVNAPE
jgi:hypothetical protein